MKKAFRLELVIAAAMLTLASAHVSAQAPGATPPVATKGMHGWVTGINASSNPAGGGAMGAPGQNAGGRGGQNPNFQTGNNGNGVGNRGLGNQGNTTPFGNTGRFGGPG